MSLVSSLITIYLKLYFVLGSSHSDKEVDPNTPEKVPRTPSERKRKRKADDSSVAPKNVRNATSDKKINDYFKHSGNSPIRHGGAKSPSPQQPYPMVSAHGFHVRICPGGVGNIR